MDQKQQGNVGLLGASWYVVWHIICRLLIGNLVITSEISRSPYKSADCNVRFSLVFDLCCRILSRNDAHQVS